jgi:hypothetical protein
MQTTRTEIDGVRRVRITVRGRLSTRLALAFEGLSAQYDGGRTELVGHVADQAQLHGLLSRIRDLGLELEQLTVSRCVTT